MVLCVLCVLCGDLRSYNHNENGYMQLLMRLHEGLSTTILLFLLALAAWGFLNYLRGPGVTGSYWGTLAIGEGLIVVEGLVGFALSLLGNLPARGWLHILYGVVAVISIPAAFAFTRGRSGRYELLIYALAALFLAGVTSRLRLTGGG